MKLRLPRHYQILKIMKRGGWWTLPELQRKIGGLTTGISASLRKLRRPTHGGHDIISRVKSNHRYTYEYKLEQKKEFKKCP